MKTPPVVVVREELQPNFGGDWFATKQEPGMPPVFSTRQAAWIFYARSWEWLERWFRDPVMKPEIDALRIPTPRGKARQMQLRHIEEISHILFKYGKIDYRKFVNTLLIIKAMADNFGLLIGE